MNLSQSKTLMVPSSNFHGLPQLTQLEEIHDLVAYPLGHLGIHPFLLATWHFQDRFSLIQKSARASHHFLWVSTDEFQLMKSEDSWNTSNTSMQGAHLQADALTNARSAKLCVVDDPGAIQVQSEKATVTGTSTRKKTKQWSPGESL